jgi:glucose-1-phosphate thymidylyltransferase
MARSLAWEPWPWQRLSSPGSSVVVVCSATTSSRKTSLRSRGVRGARKGSRILLKEVSRDDGKRFGVAEVREAKIVRIEEKPDDPKSNLVVTGCYLHDARVFDSIRMLVPSGRGELEVTDLNSPYIEEGTLAYDLLKDGGLTSEPPRASSKRPTSWP